MKTYKAVNILTTEGQKLPAVLIPWHVTTSYKDTEEEREQDRYISAGRYLRDDLKLTFNSFTLKEASKKEVTDYNKDEAISYLKTILTPGQIVYTVLRSVSASGMSRKIDLLIVNNGNIQNINFYVLQSEGSSTEKWEKGVTANGCGMDMGFNLVYNLSYRLFNDPNNKESDAGYKLKHQWL